MPSLEPFIAIALSQFLQMEGADVLSAMAIAIWVGRYCS